MTSTKQHVKTCRLCQEKFISQRSDAKFCSSSCRSIYCRQKNGPSGSQVIAEEPHETFSQPMTAWNFENTYYPLEVPLTYDDPAPYYRHTLYISRFEEYAAGAMFGSKSRIANRRYEKLFFNNEHIALAYVKKWKLDRLHWGKLIIEGNQLYVPDGW